MYARVFKEKDTLRDMLFLRYYGLSITDLADEFRCNPTTITYQCAKYGIYRDNRSLPSSRTRPKTYLDFDNQPINIGKNYKEYIREQEERRKHAFSLRIRNRIKIQILL